MIFVRDLGWHIRVQRVQYGSATRGITRQYLLTLWATRGNSRHSRQHHHRGWRSWLCQSGSSWHHWMRDPAPLGAGGCQTSRLQAHCCWTSSPDRVEILPGYLPHLFPGWEDEDVDSFWSWERYCPQTKHNPDQGCVPTVCSCHDQEDYWLCCPGQRPVGCRSGLPPVWSPCWQPWVLGAPLCTLSEWRTEALHACGTCVGHCHYLVDGWCPQELHYPGEEGPQVLRPHSSWRHSGLGLLWAGQAPGDWCCCLYSLWKHHPVEDQHHPGIWCCQVGGRQEVQSWWEVSGAGVEHGGDHVFVPFAMEDGGTLGAHALALLKMLAEYAVAQGCYTKCTDELPHGSVDLLLLLLLVCANDKLNAWFCDSFARQTVLVATDPTRRLRHCLIATVVSSSSSSSSPLLFFALLLLLSSSLPPPPPPPPSPCSFSSVSPPSSLRVLPPFLCPAASISPLPYPPCPPPQRCASSSLTPPPPPFSFSSASILLLLFLSCWSFPILDVHAPSLFPPLSLGLSSSCP